MHQLDYEKYQNRVDTARKKTKRSERDNASLEKAEQELVKAKEVRAAKIFKICVAPECLLHGTVSIANVNRSISLQMTD